MTAKERERITKIREKISNPSPYPIYPGHVEYDLEFLLDLIECLEKQVEKQIADSISEDKRVAHEMRKFAVECKDKQREIDELRYLNDSFG